MQVQEQQQTAFETLKDQFGYTNVMQCPRLDKVVLSTGVGRIRHDAHKMGVIEDRMARIAGQKIAPSPARKSIAQFKIREGDTAGFKVTLSGQRARDMLDKLIHIALPRTKDFRGIARTSVDEMGNLTIGIKEHTIFPETGDEDIRDVFSMAVTIVTTAPSREEAIAYFEHLGIPFKKELEDTNA
ncbi:MAG: large ribosomal subunit protein uL5 [Patescibacteria group bacterium]